MSVPHLRIRIWGIVAAVLLAAIAALAQNASTELNAGVQAYRSAHYESAIQHFEAALQLEPKLSIAHLYLATAYMGNYIPGSESAENVAFAEKSIAQFKWLLDNNPSPGQKRDALQGLGALNFQMKRLDSASDYYHQLLGVEPNNAETYYSLAVIDWMQAYQPRMELRNSMGLKPTDEMPIGTGCSQLRALNQEKVEDGIQQLKKAIEIKPDYDDAMAYMNLLYRERADYECGDPALRAADIKTADSWVDRTMQVKKEKADRADSAVQSHP